MATRFKHFGFLLLWLCSPVLAQEEWQLIESFEGEGLKKGGVSAIPTLEDQDDNIWFVTNSGNLYQYNNNELIETMNLGCATPLKQKKLHNEDCFKLFKGPQEALWLTSKNKGISKFIDGEWVDLSPEIGDYDKHINCSLVDSRGNIWFGTNSGVLRYNNVMWQVYRDENLQPENEVRQITEDQAGNIWISTERNLVYRFDGTNWQKRDLVELGIEPGDYRNIFPDSKGKVWIIAQSAIGFFSGEEWTSFGNSINEIEVLEMKKVIKYTYYNLDKRLLITEGEDGLIWLAHLNGVSVYDGNSWKTFKAGDELPDKWQVHSFYPASDGYLYTGTFKNDGEIYKLSLDGVEKIPIKDEKFMVSIFEDSQHNIWVSGSKGVFKISHGSNTSEVFEKPSMGYMYHDAFEDSQGRIWFGMQGFKSRVLLYTPDPSMTN